MIPQLPNGHGNGRVVAAPRIRIQCVCWGNRGSRVMGEAAGGVTAAVLGWAGGRRRTWAVVLGTCRCQRVSVPPRATFEVFALPRAFPLLPTSHNLSANVLIIIKDLFLF